MKIGIVGYKGAGKSTLFAWLTGEPADPALSHTTQAAMATVVDPRVAQLCAIYHPKKATQAALELVDTPGLNRTHEGSAAKLAMIREAGCLVVVVAAYGDTDALADLRNFEDDLLIADLDILSGRIERLRDQSKKPRPNRDELQRELHALEPLQAAMEAGRPLRDIELTPEQKKATRSFQLFSEKPRLLLLNIAEDEPQPHEWCERLPAGIQAEAVSLSLQRELARMEPAECQEFCREMGVAVFDRGHLIRRIMDVSQQMLFFTVSDKEVHSWLIRKGGTALEAAATVHTDLAHGFIRAEVMSCDDLIRSGSEREIKAHNLMRHEHKDYVVQPGEILFIRHN
jgi:ribosome-binding ATPase YchF (GTP1/OBG family)